jgi:hypothetical protein
MLGCRRSQGKPVQNVQPNLFPVQKLGKQNRWQGERALRDSLSRATNKIAVTIPGMAATIEMTVPRFRVLLR